MMFTPARDLGRADGGGLHDDTVVGEDVGVREPRAFRFVLLPGPSHELLVI